MTKILEKAIAEAAKLTKQEQDAFGAWMLEELASERRWDELFAKSAPTLERLADEAITEFREGRTQELDPDHL